VAAANALILKKAEGVALKVRACFSGNALGAVTALGLSKFGEWQIKLLTDSAGQDPKLVHKLTQVVQHGLVMEDKSAGNALNFRKMTSRGDIGAVYRQHIPRMYNLVLAVIRAHNAKELMRKVEREGGQALDDAGVAFNEHGEILQPQTPAVTKVMQPLKGTQSLKGAVPPKAKRGLRLGDGGEYEEHSNIFDYLTDGHPEQDLESHGTEEDYVIERWLTAYT
jgi:hypothetical protein